MRTSQRWPSGQADASMKVAVATLAMRNGNRTRPLVRLREHAQRDCANYDGSAWSGQLAIEAGMEAWVPVHLQVSICTVPPVHMLQDQLQQECHSQQEHLRNKRQPK